MLKEFNETVFRDWQEADVDFETVRNIITKNVIVLLYIVRSVIWRIIKPYYTNDSLSFSINENLRFKPTLFLRRINICEIKKKFVKVRVC